jgi:hypothetical protein
MGGMAGQAVGQAPTQMGSMGGGSNSGFGGMTQTAVNPQAQGGFGGGMGAPQPPNSMGGSKLNPYQGPSGMGIGMGGVPGNSGFPDPMTMPQQPRPQVQQMGPQGGYGQLTQLMRQPGQMQGGAQVQQMPSSSQLMSQLGAQSQPIQQSQMQGRMGGFGQQQQQQQPQGIQQLLNNMLTRFQSQTQQRPMQQMPQYQNQALQYRPNMTQAQQSLNRVQPSVQRQNQDTQAARIAELEAQLAGFQRPNNDYGAAGG